MSSNINGSTNSANDNTNPTNPTNPNSGAKFSPLPSGKGIVQQCTAHRKSDHQRCQSIAVHGYTVCRMHGANPNNHGGRAPIHGRYSKVLQQNASLLELYAQYKDDPELTNLASEIALVRAALADFLKTIVESTSTSTSTSGATTTAAVADAKVPSLTKKIIELTEQIGKLVERKHKIDYGEQYTLNVPQLVVYASRIADTINRYVEDPETRALIRAELEGVFAEG